MINKFSYHFTGDCPQTKTKQDIQINYFEITQTCSATHAYKKDAYYCPLKQDCPFPNEDDFGRCPVYLAAPNQPR